MNKPTPEQIERTKTLRIVIKDKIKRGDHPAVLDLWVAPCKTKGCVLGDYLIKTQPKFINKLRHAELVHFCNDFDFEVHFGFDPELVVEGDLLVDVTGCSVWGSLEERLNYVEQVLAGWGVNFDE